MVLGQVVDLGLQRGKSATDRCREAIEFGVHIGFGPVEPGAHFGFESVEPVVDLVEPVVDGVESASEDMPEKETHRRDGCDLGGTQGDCFDTHSYCSRVDQDWHRVNRCPLRLPTPRGWLKSD